MQNARKERFLRTKACEEPMKSGRTSSLIHVPHISYYSTPWPAMYSFEAHVKKLSSYGRTCLQNAFPKMTFRIADAGSVTEPSSRVSQAKG